MTDQVAQEFDTKFVGSGGGAGITSVNGDLTAAQLIVASTGILVGNAGATRAIGNDGVLTVAKSGNPLRKGNIVLTPGIGISITEGPNGTYTIDATGVGAGILTINGDGTVAQVLAAGAGISITPGPAGTNTIAVTGGAGIVTINADAAAAQTLVPAANSGFVIANTGGGVHTFKGPTSDFFGITAGGGVFVPANAVTVLVSHVMAAGTAGLYFVTGGSGVNGIAGMLLDMFILVNGVIQAVGSTGLTESPGQTLGGPIVGRFFFLVPGDVVAVGVNHHGGGAATTSLDSLIQGFKIST